MSSRLDELTVFVAFLGVPGIAGSAGDWDADARASRSFIVAMTPGCGVKFGFGLTFLLLLLVAVGVDFADEVDIVLGLHFTVYLRVIHWPCLKIPET